MQTGLALVAQCKGLERERDNMQVGWLYVWIVEQGKLSVSFMTTLDDNTVWAAAPDFVSENVDWSGLLQKSINDMQYSIQCLWHWWQDSLISESQQNTSMVEILYVKWCFYMSRFSGQGLCEVVIRICTHKCYNSRLESHTWTRIHYKFERFSCAETAFSCTFSATFLVCSLFDI